MQKRHLRVIREIQERIPKELLMRLMKKEKLGQPIKTVLEHALTLPDTEVNPRQRRRIQALLDSGKLDREVDVLDHTIEQQIDAFIDAEIALAVKLGRLPKEAPKLKSLKNKGNQYARRQEKRLRREFLGESENVVFDAKDGPQNQSKHSTLESDGGFLLEPGAATGGQ